MEDKKIELKPVVALSGHRFVIDGYQRGYKWGKKEILELLNDFDSFDVAKGIYCLQPLILNPLIDGSFEVVDGQQRTTTLYILLNYLVHKGYVGNEYLYHLDYKTRQRSGAFLKDKLKDIFEVNLKAITAQELESKDYDQLDALHQLWSTYIQQQPDYDNVDVYHFFTVACYIIRWIEEELTEDLKKDQFINILLNAVHVIWYKLEGDDTGNVIKVFLNNNKGKINLTSSELIKALFILFIRNKESFTLADLQINQFAMEWDTIEKQLQDDRFWYFIQSDESKYTEGTRIDYLFDLFFKRDKNKDLFFAYRKVEETFNNLQINIIDTVWEKVIQLYYKFLNWYQDPILYHLVGYLINSKIKNISHILQLSVGKDKLLLQVELESAIKDEFSKKMDNKDPNSIQKYALKNLDYEDNYDPTKRVLLLHNVMYYKDNMASFKFPFDLYNKNKWSIEHITPQNPKDLPDIKTLVQWIKDLHIYTNNNLDQNFICEIEKYNLIADLKKDKDLIKRMDDLAVNNSEVTHSINNLLLLDKNTNSSLGNKLFADKREKILAFDKEGKTDDGRAIFIPMETLNAFNKTFSSKINIENWTKEDGDAYVNSIAERLKDYLPN